LVFRSRRDEWIIAYPVASISPRINKVDVTIREVVKTSTKSCPVYNEKGVRLVQHGGATRRSPLGPLGIVFRSVPKKQFTSTLI
jgi:hypothetical protein